MPRRMCIFQRYNFLLLLVVIFVNIPVYSADNYLPGSRFAAMAMASVMIPDIWSVSHNQAGLAYLKEINFSVHHENKFVVPQYGLNALAFSIPTKPGSFGGSFYYFGYSKYHEIKTGLAYSKLFGEKFSAGVQINYHSVYISEHYGRSSALSVEGGIMAQPIENLFIGAHIFNPSRSKYNTPDGEEFLPVTFRLGIGYYLIDRIWIGLETQKETNFNAVWKIGLEIEAINHLFLRGGLGTDPILNTFGIGYEILGLRGDLAFSFHPQLGFTPHFTLTYSLQ